MEPSKEIISNKNNFKRYPFLLNEIQKNLDQPIFSNIVCFKVKYFDKIKNTTSNISNQKQGNSISVEFQECIICLKIISIKGNLDSCSHVFCFGCIEKWLKSSSNCPICRKEVSLLTKYENKNRSKKYKIKKKIQSVPQESFYHEIENNFNSFCDSCNSSLSLSGSDYFTCCSCSEKFIHSECIRYRNYLSDFWLCNSCNE
jgi:hypothetical protein